MQKQLNATISSEALRPGDLIFTIDSNGVAGHVAIWAPQEGSILSVAHAIRRGVDLVLKTALEVPGEGLSYLVLRNKDPHLARMAAKQANRWCRFGTPYDTNRLEVGERRESTLSVHKENPQAALNAYQRFEFEKGGKYRLIKYASRRMGPISLPKSCGGSGRGMRCCLFALSCFQTAALSKYDLVKPLCGDSATRWVSDKYTSLDLIKQSKPSTESIFNKGAIRAKFKTTQAWKNDVSSYCVFIEKIRKHDTEFKDYTHYKDHKFYDENRIPYAPSLLAWDYEKNGSIETFPFENVLGEGLMLEPKTTSPAMLLYALSQDKTMWHDAMPMRVSNETALVTGEEKPEQNQDVTEFRVALQDYLSGKIDQFPWYAADILEEKEMRQEFGQNK